MAKRHILHLTAEQEQELRDLRDTGDRAYLRERAAALLKIASGIAPHKVALSGLLKKRKPDTLYTWLRRYREHGISGLRHKPGRGRKPAYAPHTDEEAEAELHQLVHHPPQLIDNHETRWILRAIGKSISWLRDKSLAAVHKYSHDSASAISAAESISTVPIRNMHRNLNAYKPLYNLPSKPLRLMLRFTKMSSHFTNSPLWQKIGLRPEQRPRLLGIISVLKPSAMDWGHLMPTPVIWFITKQRV